MYREEEEKVRYVGSDIYSTGVVRFVFGMLLVFSAARWQRTYDDLKSLLLQERFLSDDRLNSYLIEKLGPKELERSRITFLRLCQSASNCGIVPPFIYYESRQMVAPKFRTAACVIYKNVSTILTAIMCYLYDAVTYKKHVTDMIQDTYNKRFCKYKNEYESIRALTSFRNSSSVDSMDWFNILVVRDPLERFISAFVNKCLKIRVNFTLVVMEINISHFI
ncbi:unnamed protein product [Nippostrongylus brasiliensis]|uniref:Carbohydrate sulfotransferase n=1 Tax=Nippostrongylus brasiliensis TaxID=27835 RepID=A0A0N4Y2H1_NIPBR|nr:unnamed protein product [Nippostrongylus brasiliensis]